MVMIKHLKRHNSPDSTSHRDGLPLVVRIRQKEEQKGWRCAEVVLDCLSIIVVCGLYLYPEYKLSPLCIRLKLS